MQCWSILRQVHDLFTQSVILGMPIRRRYIFPLTADYLGFDDSNGVGPLPGQHLVEAPALFKRQHTYYALLGGCTCMGLYGGGVNVLMASHPLGPWRNVSATIDPGCPMWKQSTCFEMGPGAVCNPVTQAQQNYVITVPLASGGGSGGEDTREWGGSEGGDGAL